jgi:hypothetical protein
MVRIAHGLVPGVLLALLAGCGKSPPTIVPVEGVVRMEGKPLKKALVRFIPVENHGAAYLASGVTDEAGRFELKCNGQLGACTGEHHVLVAEAEIPPRLRSETAQLELVAYFEKLGGRPIPRKYANATDSPLRAEVKEEQKEYNFDLSP